MLKSCLSKWSLGQSVQYGHQVNGTGHGFTIIKLSEMCGHLCCNGVLSCNALRYWLDASHALLVGAAALHVVHRL